MAKAVVDDKEHGEPIPYDPDFNGPLRKRSCTDVLCLAVFICFIAAWAGIGLYAIQNGDPSLLLVPRDSAGRRCGRDVLHKPYLFFHDLTRCLSPTTPFTGCPTPQVCVSACPTEAYVDTATSQRPNQFLDYCVNSNSDLICPNWILPSTAFQKRCIPAMNKVTDSIINDINNNTAEKVTLPELFQSVTNIKLLSDVEETGQNIVEDVIRSWWKIIIGVLLALVICLIYIVILRWLAALMVWISIFGVLVGLGAGLYFSVVKYIETRDAYTKVLNDQTRYEDEREYESSHFKTKRDLWLAGLIIISVVLGIILLVLIFLRKRIYLAIALIKEGSKAVSSVTASLCFPIVPWILQICVIGYAIIVGVYLASTGKPLYKTRHVDENCTKEITIPDDVKCDPDLWITLMKNSSIAAACVNASCRFIGTNDVLYPYLQAYNIFGFLWLAFFVTALGQMVLAGIFAQWYWTFNKTQIPFFAVTSAFFRTLRYHIGTLAFGSLIIAICRIIRIILEYLDHKLKQYDNEFTRAIMCLLKCFFYCLEKFLRFLNKNAYIMCAIHGKNFCISAKNAFMLLLRNIVRVWVLDKVTDFLFFLSKLMLTLGVGAVSYVFFVSGLLPTSIIDNSGLNYGIVPVVIIMICTYLISTLFFSVYTMAVDTLFLCFLEDCERNDGSPEKPYYMSKNLMNIFGKKNKID
ncbi:unnamed protein product [Psylliodes chrysocephalus]|uniref:Choline transporter-like protein n=1 Tax=Psylliodes chrysocephalus TaxID=3402493 RepID=A0A9P0G8S2_9CUCU|nr:unnamed protein product [Psylliodes chrysocephala]